MVTTRSEQDLLGTLKVPSEAYFGIHTLRAVENFVISGTAINEFPQLIIGMVQVKKAAAIANKNLHTLPAFLADAIVQGCDEILVNGRCMDQFPIDVFQGGAGTSVNMNVNEVIANLALETLGYDKGRYDIIDPNDHVNKSQSTNDAYPTGLRLALYALTHELIEELTLLRESFYDKSEDFRRILKMGRTQLQDAVPMSLGQEFGAYAVTVNDEIQNLTHSALMLLETNLGATAIGTRLNTVPGYAEEVVSVLACNTGLGVSGAEDLIEATSDTGAFVNVHASYKRLAVKLSKICNDLRLLSSGPRAGLGEINLPQLQAGSSIMPAKVNPVIPEVVNQVCFNVIGHDTTVTLAAEAGQLQLNVMEPVIAYAMWQSASLLTTASASLREKCVEGITANEKVCTAGVMNSIGIVTYLNPVIGHHNGDRVGRECLASGRGVREVVLEMGLLDEQTLDAVLSAKNLLQPKYSGKIYD